MLIGGNLTAQLTGSHRDRKIKGGIQITETWLQALLPFPTPPPERPGELARRLRQVCQAEHEGIEEMMMKNIFITII